jgi:hypothetical protein
MASREPAKERERGLVDFRSRSAANPRRSIGLELKS